MKTRNLLLAMALPTVFAACTAEDLVNQTETNVLESRALLGDLKVSIENNVTSRAAWSDKTLTWGEWEEDDVLTSAVVDATRGTVGDNLLTNYIWSKDANGTWGTTSQMVEGIYSFYSYKGIATKNDREPVAFDLTAQTADLDNPTKVIDDNQLFFSPLYNIEAKNTTAENTIDLPLQFYPYHSIGAFKMTNATGETLLISQIIAEGEFAAKGKILPTKLFDEGLYWTVRKGESEYKLYYKDDKKGTEWTATEAEKLWQTSVLDNAETACTIAMTCGNWEWANGTEITAYMVIPAGAKVTDVKINVVNEEGEAKYINVTDSRTSIKDEDGKVEAYTIASTGIEEQSFKRSVPVSVFGYTAASAPKGITVKAGNLADLKGYYIDNKTALIKLLDMSRGEVLVYNFGAFSVDAEIADVITEYTGGEVIFQNPIEIEDAENVVSVNNIKFMKDVTVKEGTAVIFEDATVSTLKIEAGATVTIKGGSYTSVENAGALTVKSDVTEVTTTGALTMVGNDSGVVLNAGSVEYVAAVDENGKAIAFKVENLSVDRDSDKNASVTIGENVTWKPAKEITMDQAYTGSSTGTISKSLTVTVDGEIDSEKYLRFGNLTNNGTIKSEETVLVAGTTTNNGEITIAKNSIFAVAHDKDLVSAGTLNNYGDIFGDVRADKGGYVMAAKGSSMTLVAGNGTTTGCARVNNTAGGNVGVPATGNNYVIYHQFDEDFTLADLYDIDYVLYHINTVVVNGVTFSWDVENMTGKNPDWNAFNAAIKSIELNNGSVLDVASGNTNQTISMTNVKVAGSVKINGWSAEQSGLKFASAATVNMASGATLTLQKVTFDASNVNVVGVADDNSTEKIVVKSGAVVTLDGSKITNVNVEGAYSQPATVNSLLDGLN